MEQKIIDLTNQIQKLDSYISKDKLSLLELLYIHLEMYLQDIKLKKE